MTDDRPSVSRVLTLPTVHLLAKSVLFCVILTLLYNITATLLPMARRADEMSDIALTASQRSLLGLDPGATPPATPATAYVTPPRYPRSPTPQQSPASSPRSEALVRRLSSRSAAATPPSSDSPFTGRRPSYGSPSPLGLNTSTSNVSPSPLTRSHSGLHSKWLYERGKRSSGVY